jgi:hypothetical protein
MLTNFGLPPSLTGVIKIKKYYMGGNQINFFYKGYSKKYITGGKTKFAYFAGG